MDCGWGRVHRPFLEGGIVFFLLVRVVTTHCSVALRNKHRGTVFVARYPDPFAPPPPTATMCGTCRRRHGRDAKRQKQPLWAEGQLSHSHLVKISFPG